LAAPNPPAGPPGGGGGGGPPAALLGGLRGRWWGTAWEVQQLWVDAQHRRRGHATRLLAEFEALARRRGGAVIYLDTFSFQAPALYLGCGFRVAWQVAGFPGAHVKYVMEKRLD
jgi:ribosomal protein S18 acetylase RimI-like enzyme